MEDLNFINTDVDSVYNLVLLPQMLHRHKSKSNQKLLNVISVPVSHKLSKKYDLYYIRAKHVVYVTKYVTKTLS